MGRKASSTLTAAELRLMELIGFVSMWREAIFMGINTDRANTQLGCCSQDTYGNFTAIGDEDFIDSSSRHNIPRSTGCIDALIVMPCLRHGYWFVVFLGVEARGVRYSVRTVS